MLPNGFAPRGAAPGQASGSFVCVPTACAGTHAARAAARRREGVAGSPPPVPTLPGHSWFPAAGGFCDDVRAHVRAGSRVQRPQLWVRAAYFGFTWSQMLFLESLDTSFPRPVAF